MKEPAATEMPDGRHAAGEDPAKRDQILSGAHAVFTRLGFDAASMNDICREAGVSKGTLYVYFSGKEDLFTNLIERERGRLFPTISEALESDAPIAERLMRFAMLTGRKLCSEEVVRAQRIVLGICERMPELGARFYEGGGQRAVRLLARFMEVETARGLLAVPDPMRAAYQFHDLCTSGLLRRRLFGHMTEPPSDEELSDVAGAAVAMFLHYYGVTPEHAAPDGP